MTTHSNILAWEIPWTGEPGGPQSLEFQRVRHGWVSVHAQISTTHSSLHIFVQVSHIPGSFPTDLILVFCLFPCPLPAPSPQVLLPKEISPVSLLVGFSCGSAGKQSACNAGDLGSIRRLGRSPGEGKGYPFQYSGLENSMDCIAHGVSRSRLQLGNLHFTSRLSRGPNAVTRALTSGKWEGRQAGQVPGVLTLCCWLWGSGERDSVIQEMQVSSGNKKCQKKEGTSALQLHRTEFC